MPGKNKRSIECWVLSNPPSLTASILLLQAEAKGAQPAFWQPITGGMEPGETAEQACLREIREETGLVVEASALAKIEQTFDVQIDEHLTLHKTLFLAVVPNQQVQISEEHIGWQWAPFQKAKKLLYWPSNHETYAAISQFLKA